MKRFTVALFLLLVCTPLFSAARTFVSISGTDSGTCPTTAPCRSLSYAFTQTDNGGDIVVQNSGGFGFPFTITHGVNIIVPSSIYAVIQINTDLTQGLTINAGASDIIRISGLTIIGTGATLGDVAVVVQQCKRTELTGMNIQRVATGIKVLNDVRVVINNNQISDVDKGVWIVGSNADSSTSTLKVIGSNNFMYGGDIGLQVDKGTIIFSGGQYAYFATHGFIMASSVSNCSQAANLAYFSGSSTQSNAGGCPTGP